MYQGRYGPDHWEILYREQRTPWDAGGVPGPLTEFLGEAPPQGRALVPGCGSGYEAVALARAGLEVTAIDFSAAAVKRATEVTHGWPVSVLQADFFEVEFPGFDLIYERAFLCALPPELRARWAAKCAELLCPGGLLLGLFFTDPEAVDGPPFGVAQDKLAELLTAAFELRVDAASEGSLPAFIGRERWQIWERRR